jgi:hypothetical protein
MGKLPGNLPKPAFDNPLRPTTSSTAAVVIPMNGSESGPSLAAAPAPVLDEPAPLESAAAPIHRQSVSFTDAQWKALQAECHRRRMAGDKGVNVARVVRDLVEEWRTRVT